MHSTASTIGSKSARARSGGEPLRPPAWRGAAPHQQITDGVAALIDDLAWRAKLDAVGGYNLKQPDADRRTGRSQGVRSPTRLAGVWGYGTWQAAARYVLKDASGLAVLPAGTLRVSELSTPTRSMSRWTAPRPARRGSGPSTVAPGAGGSG